jgi:hypothetical protein
MFDLGEKARHYGMHRTWKIIPSDASKRNGAYKRRLLSDANWCRCSPWILKPQRYDPKKVTMNFLAFCTNL